VNTVELEELAVSLADLLFHMPLPKVSSEAKGAIGLLVHGDVIGALELDHVIALGFVFVIPPCLSVVEQGQPQLLTRQTQGFDILDLRFDFGEVRHVFLSVDGSSGIPLIQMMMALSLSIV